MAAPVYGGGAAKRGRSRVERSQSRAVDSRPHGVVARAPSLHGGPSSREAAAEGATHAEDQRHDWGGAGRMGVYSAAELRRG